MKEVVTIMRQAFISRDTEETHIELTLVLDGTGKCTLDTGIGFLDHMLVLFAHHGRFDLTLHVTGDLHVDSHHTVEDIGICLGRALNDALGDRRGITRYGNCLLPMDEALILTALDISGRPHLSYGLSLPTGQLGTLETETIQEFFLGFTRASGCTLHLKQLAGTNTHHIIEGAFKGFGRALAEAIKADPARADEMPSSKGTIL